MGSAATETKETSIAARVREIAMAASGNITVGEITRAVVKSMRISPLPAAKEDWESWRKQVSNSLGRLAKQRLLERVKGKKGTYCRPGAQQENDRANCGEDLIALETPQAYDEAQRARWLAFRKANRMNPPENPGDPMPIGWPCGLQREFRIFPKNIGVVGGVTNSCKTAFGLEFARLNMDRYRITYINSEMSEEELAERLQLFEQAYGIPEKTFYNKVYFAACNCNALNKKDMDRLVALLDPDGINIIDYMKINDKFFMIGDCLEQIHARLNQGIAVVFFQKDPDAPHLLGKSFPEHLARVVMMIDIDKETQLRCLQFTKVKAPTQKGDRPESRQIWFNVEGGVRLERTAAPTRARGQQKAKGAM